MSRPSSTVDQSASSHAHTHSRHTHTQRTTQEPVSSSDQLMAKLSEIEQLLGELDDVMGDERCSISTTHCHDPFGGLLFLSRQIVRSPVVSREIDAPMAVAAKRRGTLHATHAGQHLPLANRGRWRWSTTSMTCSTTSTRPSQNHPAQRRARCHQRVRSHPRRPLSAVPDASACRYWSISSVLECLRQ